MSALARGIVLQKDGEQLVIQATEAEVVQFALGGAVTAVGKATFGGPWGIQGISDDGVLYTKDGKPVAYIQDCTINRQMIEVTTFGDYGKQQFVNGLPEYEIRARGPVR